MLLRLEGFRLKHQLTSVPCSGVAEKRGNYHIVINALATARDRNRADWMNTVTPQKKAMKFLSSNARTLRNGTQTETERQVIKPVSPSGEVTESMLSFQGGPTRFFPSIDDSPVTGQPPTWVSPSKIPTEQCKAGESQEDFLNFSATDLRPYRTHGINIAFLGDSL